MVKKVLNYNIVGIYWFFFCYIVFESSEMERNFMGYDDEIIYVYILSRRFFISFFC